ncbi:MAG: sigma-70 family RNA polymerase sigma factor [Solirubrobacterales bacterium]
MPEVQAGHLSAFEVLYDRHAGAGYALAYRMLGRKQAAEDVIQESFLAVWRNRSRYDRTRGSVRSWLLWTVRNRAIDALRKQQSATPTLDSDDDATLERQEAGEPTADVALRNEQAAQVRGALSGLPDDQQRVLRLAFFSGYTHSEIAKRLELPLGTVKGRIRLGLEKVRTGLGEWAEDDR